MWEQVSRVLNVAGNGSSPRKPEQMQSELIRLADEFDVARRQAREKRASKRAAKQVERTDASQNTPLVNEIAADKKATSILAALGALTADWDEVQAIALKEVEQRRLVERRKEAVADAVQQERGRARRDVWLDRLLRWGVAAWFIQWIRSMDIPEYIDYKAAKEMRQAALGNPIYPYKHFLEKVAIPQAKWIALGEVVGAFMVAVAMITGIKRKAATKLGIAISGHQLAIGFREPMVRAANVLMIVLQLIILRGPKPAEPISAARRELAEIPQIDD